MKIVDKQTFLKLPPKTVYAKYSSVGIFDEICIKGGTIAEIDWTYQALIEVNEESVSLLDLYLQAESDPDTQMRLDHDCARRDGNYQDELFAVFDDADIKNLISLLSSCLKHDRT